MSTWSGAADRLEDVRWMAETGECLDGAARRLGVKANALEKWLQRHDKETLATLVAKQPRDHNLIAERGAVAFTPRQIRGREKQRRRYQRRREVAA